MSGFELTAGEAALVAFVALVAGLLRGFSGFGAALVIAPVLAWAVGPRAAIPAILLAMMVTSVQLVPRAWKDANWPVVVPLSVGGVLCMPLGAWLLISLDQEIMRRAISGLVIVFALLMLVGWRYRGRIHAGISAAVGAASGFISGAAAGGGPVVIMFLLAGPENAVRNRAAIIVYFGFVQLATLAVYSIVGLMTWRTLWIAAPMIPTVALGTWAGARLFGHASDILYRRIALGILLAIGVSTLFA